jgi:MFS-type transporter involved in bile tolerance (Atg22 family)
VVRSFAAYWFYLLFGVAPVTLGAIFFRANVFAGISALFASRLAARIGLVRTMVVTHLPSNILLILVPLMPSLSHVGASSPFQHQPDGCSHEAVLYPWP